MKPTPHCSQFVHENVDSIVQDYLRDLNAQKNLLSHDPKKLQSGLSKWRLAYFEPIACLFGPRPLLFLGLKKVYARPFYQFIALMRKIDLHEDPQKQRFLNFLFMFLVLRSTISTTFKTYTVYEITKKILKLPANNENLRYRLNAFLSEATTRLTLCQEHLINQKQDLCASSPDFIRLHAKASHLHSSAIFQLNKLQLKISPKKQKKQKKQKEGLYQLLLSDDGSSTHTEPNLFC
ncbi:MAG: hypothetical protein VXW87_03980 [Pseudomonadota bacterium]|nr:hypothetical protein [Pseudomonadota bacterium]